MRVGIGRKPKFSKQMRSFGTLYGPQRTQKKSFEQLRSSSIDWWCQLVRAGTIKLKKWSVCFLILDHRDFAVLLTARILMFWCPGRLWKIKIRPRKSILVKIWSKMFFLWFLTMFDCYHKFLFWCHFCDFANFDDFDVKCQKFWVPQPLLICLYPINWK